MVCIYNYGYRCPRQKNNNLAADILEHPAIVSMIIAVRLPPIHSPTDIISIAFLNQRYNIYSTYLIEYYQLWLLPVSSISHPLVVVTLYLWPTKHHIKKTQH